MKKILFIVNYYYPYIRGVSEYLRLLAEEMAKTNEVVVLTSNHEKLPPEEMINGVKVIRSPIICRISKGTVSPQFILRAIKMSKSYDIVNLHMPMIESGIIASFVKKSKIYATYQCDVNLPKGLLNNFIVKFMDFSNNLCLKRAEKIVVLSIDYATQSRIANRYRKKLVEIAPPIKEFNRVVTEKDNFKRIGFCGRIVEEKGIDVLLKAFQIIKKEHQNTKLMIVGDFKNVAGGSIYPVLIDYIKENNIEDVEFVGKILESTLAGFYSSVDVFVLPSINSLEAFGMVQVEAMKCGTPVVASDLPGVRTVVQRTGMGLISERGNPQSLAECITKVLTSPEAYIKEKNIIDSLYSIEKTAADYFACFNGQQS